MNDKFCDTCKHCREYHCSRIDRPIPFPDRDTCDHWQTKGVALNKSIWEEGFADGAAGRKSNSLMATDLSYNSGYIEGAATIRKKSW